MKDNKIIDTKECFHRWEYSPHEYIHFCRTCGVIHPDDSARYARAHEQFDKDFMEATREFIRSMNDFWKKWMKRISRMEEK